MNILFLTHYTELYGANKSLINLIEGLKIHDIKPLVIVPYEGEICNVLKKKKIAYIIQNFHNWSEVKQNSSLNYKGKIVASVKRHLKYILNKYSNRKNLNILIKKTAFFNPDLVYSNSSVFNFGILFSKKINKPHIWHLREFGVEDYNMYFINNLKYVKHLFNESSKVISISKSIDDYYKKKFALKNSNIIFNGVLNFKELRNLDKRRLNNYSKSRKGVVFGIIGLIHKTKGHSDAIKALSLVCKKYPDTKLVIAGNGNTKPIISLIKEFGLEQNVDFLGFIKDPFDAFLQIDTLLMCSKNEGLGRVTLEAMASNLPVIGFKSGGTTELIEENITGLYYENDHIDLYLQMIKIIENKALRNELGNNARKIFEEKFTTEVYAQKVLSVIISAKIK